MLKYVTPEESHYYIKLSHKLTHKADAFTRVADGDGWDSVYYLASAILDPTGAVRASEYVYVLVNKSVPNMVKIGMTTNTPTQRAHEISRATGVAIPWIPVFEFKCFRSDLLEAEVHEYFHTHRVNKHREMFAVDSHTAQKVIEELGYKYSSAMQDYSRLH
jgi:hypothetical protein